MDTFLAFFSVRHSLHFLSLCLSFFLKFYAGFFFLYYFGDLWNCFYYFILSGAAGGLSTARGKSLSTPRPCSDFSKITRVFPYLLPPLSSPLRFPLACYIVFCAFYQKFVFHSVGQGCCKLFYRLKGARAGRGRVRGCGRVSCMLHGVCTIFLTSSQI